MLIVRFFSTLRHVKRPSVHNMISVKAQNRFNARNYSFCQKTINDWNKLAGDCMQASSSVYNYYVQVENQNTWWHRTSSFMFLLMCKPPFSDCEWPSRIWLCWLPIVPSGGVRWFHGAGGRIGDRVHQLPHLPPPEYHVQRHRLRRLSTPHRGLHTDNYTWRQLHTQRRVCESNPASAGRILRGLRPRCAYFVRGYRERDELASHADDPRCRDDRSFDWRRSDARDPRLPEFGHRIRRDLTLPCQDCVGEKAAVEYKLSISACRFCKHPVIVLLCIVIRCRNSNYVHCNIITGSGIFLCFEKFVNILQYKWFDIYYIVPSSRVWLPVIAMIYIYIYIYYLF